MQQFECPWCGPRPQIEFTYHRDAESVPQGWPEEESEYLERVFTRTNHLGFHEELWQHSLGCRGWIVIERDNLTHAVRATRPAEGGK